MSDPKSQASSNGDLYHVLFTLSHLKRDPTAELQKVRICETYTSVKAAKAAAQRLLSDAGYEPQWFKVFEIRDSETTDWKHGDGVVTYAGAPEGETITVSISTTNDRLGLKGNKEGKVDIDLYHILQTTIFYDKDPSGTLRENNIVGTFKTYDEAREAARFMLINEEDGITKESWAEYDELLPDEKTWEWGDDVIVHAVGYNGENVLVSIVKEEPLASVSTIDEATRFR
jgi:hypothetical protein